MMMISKMNNLASETESKINGYEYGIKDKVKWNW